MPSDRAEWCYVDDCPVSICNGPHIEHECPNLDGDIVQGRPGVECAFCGAPLSIGGST